MVEGGLAPDIREWVVLRAKRVVCAARMRHGTSKGLKHTDPADPPRRRANKARGHGTWDNARPPVSGIAGHTTGQIRLTVCKNSQRKTLQAKIEKAMQPAATVNTDERKAYERLPESGRRHVSVCHAPGQREWGRDDDGDGKREVHRNTIEGIWTGLRNFLRPFRGVAKKCLSQYVAIFEWAHNLKEVTLDYLRRLMGCFTPEPT